MTTGNTPKAISVMMTLVVDAENRKLHQEIEVVFLDGAVRTIKIPMHKSIRIDMDTLYMENSDASKAG